jgi:putative membrane protein
MAVSLQTPELEAWATGFPITLLHATLAVGLLAGGAALYALLTPHREIQLIRDGNTAAALSFGGVLVGLAIPVAFAVAASASLLEIALWGVSAVVLQLGLFWLVDLVLVGLPQRIREGEVAAAALLVAARLAAAIVLAAALAA